jgi:tetratricopeptide (TPR) repeat protein
MKYSTKPGSTSGIKNAKFMSNHMLALADSLYDEEEFEKAKEVLLDEIRDTDGDRRLAAVVVYARSECASGNYSSTVEILRAHYSLAEACRDHQLCAWFHATLGAAYQQLKRFGDAEYHYTLASDHYARVNDFDLIGCVESNLGLIAGHIGRYEEAREHFASARSLLAGNPVKLAEVDDSEAQVCMLEGNWREASRLSCKACLVLIEHRAEARLRAARSVLIAAASGDAAVELKG